jgi:DhnA family fructose-bisphosphate aldolase class Ia
MSSIGKTIRMSRLIEPATGASIICALDHGMTAPQFPSRLADIRSRTREAIAGGANTLMLSRGMADKVVDCFTPTTALALMLTASAARRPGGARVVPIGQVEEALRLGADGVVVYVALAQGDEDEMIRFLAQVGEACGREGMPLIAEAEFPDAYMPATERSADLGADYLQRNVRVCCELGADIVKVNWSGDEETFAEIVAASTVPVVVAGGAVVRDVDLLERLEAARRSGAIGCSVGRNIFEHESPEAMTRAIGRVMRDGLPASVAANELSAALESRDVVGGRAAV